MWGYYHRQEPANGQWDPLKAKIIVFHDGTQHAALVSLDLGRTPPPREIQTIQRQIKEKYNIPQVLLAATHTHAGPYFGKADQPQEWLDKLVERIISGVGNAQQSLQSVSLEIGYGEVDISYDRRVVNEDGSVTMKWRNHEREPTSPVDQTMAVLIVKDDDKNILATLVHYACHPVCFGGSNLKYSADFPAGMYEYVESKTNAPCIYIQGACGEINPYMAGIEANEEGYKITLQEGRKTGKAAMDIAQHSSPIEGPLSIKTHTETTSIGLRYPISDERIQNVLKGLYSQSWLDQFIHNEEKTFAVETPILALGDKVAWVGFPGEFFSAFQTGLRERSPITHTFFAGYCNGYYSYFPTIQAAAEGGYGADYGLLTEVGAGERLLNNAIIRLYQLTGRLTKE